MGPWRRQQWATTIVDVAGGQLLDVVAGRTAAAPTRWFLTRPKAWRDGIRWATLDLSGPYRATLSAALPDAVQVADPFHVVKLLNAKLDECRRRVQNDTVGHRGRKDDPLSRGRRLLTKAAERLDDRGHAKLVGLLRAGDPHGDVATMWHAKEAVRELYPHHDIDLAGAWVDQLAADLQDGDYPPRRTRLGGR